MTDLAIPTAHDLSTPERQAALVAQAREWLAEARDIPHIEHLRAQAATLETYAKTVKASAEAITAATEIRLRAERRIGELLREEPKHAGGRPAETGQRLRPVSPEPERLADKGLTKTESSSYQRLAAVPAEQFEEAIDNGRKQGLLSRSAVLRSVQAEAPAPPPAVWADGDRFMSTCERLAKLVDEAVIAIRFGYYPGDGPDLIANRPERALAGARAALASVEAELERSQW